MATNFTKYNLQWLQNTDPLQIEFWMIRQTDEWFKARSETPYKHYKEAHRLLWPEDRQHRWFEQGLKSICENKVSVFLGAASTGKTYLMGVHALIDFFAMPHTTLSLISSTDVRSLELKIWGRIKELFNRAKQRYPYLPGYCLDAARSITPDRVDEENETARALNKGVICVPCVSNGKFVGMGKFQGAKAPNSPGKADGRLKHYGDEAAVMQASFLDAYSNWMVSPSFKGVMSGNPTDITDPLCLAAEPVGGWDSFEDTGLTQEWTSRWYGAHVICFDGRDSPNNDDQKVQYPFLISKRYVEALKETHGEDSWQLYQQGIGKPSRGMVANRVITTGLCERHGAFEPSVFANETTEIYALDPAYGGGDRCVGGFCRFGADEHGMHIFEVGTPEIIPIRLNGNLDPEEQIAFHVQNRLSERKMAADHCAYDSFGRGTLGYAFAKAFGKVSPIPIDAGGPPTDRPVRFDLFVPDNRGGKRLKRCDEHYSKFVTELWFSVREAIESGQVRCLPRNVAEEGQMRLYSTVGGNKIEVESKDEMKERVRRSPDLFDWLAISVELARRLGFKIERIGREKDKAKEDKPDWLDNHVSEFQDTIRKKRLAA